MSVEIGIVWQFRDLCPLNPYSRAWLLSSGIWDRWSTQFPFGLLNISESSTFMEGSPTGSLRFPSWLERSGIGESMAGEGWFRGVIPSITAYHLALSYVISYFQEKAWLGDLQGSNQPSGYHKRICRNRLKVVFVSLLWLVNESKIGLQSNLYLRTRVSTLVMWDSK